MLISSSST